MSSVLSGSSGVTETVRDSKETGQTNPIERLNNHLRQRVFRASGSVTVYIVM
ncbi:MAG: hypothetical protein O9276_11170 [Microcystis sp. LE17-20A]|jgi:hypothetical protein|uniref:hypothetical protein n=1 Tax=unclassified Microcystis TaxID=2643300 RepID=UPI0022C61DC9|nr:MULTISPECIES: hypothetical protein [unclassified Microcystis]MCZ8038665.1 hypothetical protein [Microcystis sp. LE17-20A]MCZ8211889.1 hypothetical protein [Microcystis sp. LE19-8.1F]